MEFKLIIKKINNTLTKEEEMLFNDWYRESETHRAYFLQAREQYENSPDTINIKKGWKLIESKVASRPKLATYWKYVAAVVILIALSPFLFISQEDKLESQPPAAVVTTSIQIGTDKATLTLEDGSNVVLQKGESYEADQIKSNGEELVYKNKPNSQIKDLAYNVLTIPRGGQFFIILSDGTKVWLNSDSKLKYPVAFAENVPRAVELIYGEAYFDVSPSSDHQGSHFFVTTQSQRVEVLGTEFNLKAYREDHVISTTLVEGKVAIKNGQISKSLIPGQQSQSDLTTGYIQINEVEVGNEISWKNGFFSFKNKPLEEIMLVLSRWYDVDIVIENTEAAKISFNGVLNKKQNIDNILSIIENTNEAKFETVGKTIILK